MEQEELQKGQRYEYIFVCNNHTFAVKMVITGIYENYIFMDKTTKRDGFTVLNIKGDKMRKSLFLAAIKRNDFKKVTNNK